MSITQIILIAAQVSLILLSLYCYRKFAVASTTASANHQDSLDKIANTISSRVSSDICALNKNIGAVQQGFSNVSENIGLIQHSFQDVASNVGSVNQNLQGVVSNMDIVAKTLTSGTTRGAYGETLLGAQIKQVLAKGQYVVNFSPKNNESRVEFAIKLGGKDNIRWLPIDSKFPIEDLKRLKDSQDKGDKHAIGRATKAFESVIKKAAGDISNKYLDPQVTTPFGIMYLPTEGLYQEVLQTEGLADSLRKDYNVIPVGPNTLWAILGSLQVVFGDLALEQNSTGVIKMLSSAIPKLEEFQDSLLAFQKKRQAEDKAISVMLSDTKETISAVQKCV